jgi:hypothetical protein
VKNRFYQGRAGSNADQQARRAAQEMARDVQNEIWGECGPNSIRQMLVEVSNKYPLGPLGITFLAVYAATTDIVEPGGPQP